MDAQGVRVLGQRVLAEQVRAVLGEVGVASELFVGLATSARDGLSAAMPGIDIVVVTRTSGLDSCAVVKKAFLSRPILAVVMPGAERVAAHWAKTRRGPDANVAWPCTGEAILNACRQASESAKVRRPWFPLSWAPPLLFSVAVIVVAGLLLTDHWILPTWVLPILLGLQVLCYEPYVTVHPRMYRVAGLISLIAGLLVVAERVIFFGWSRVLH
jgi:hypothetical protein